MRQHTRPAAVRCTFFKYANHQNQRRTIYFAKNSNTVETFSGSKTSRGKYWATPSHVTFSNEVRKCMARRRPYFPRLVLLHTKVSTVLVSFLFLLFKHQEKFVKFAQKCPSRSVVLRGPGQSVQLAQAARRVVLTIGAARRC